MIKLIERLIITIALLLSIVVVTKGFISLKHEAVETVTFIACPQAEEMIREVFGKDADVAIAIAKAESNLNPDAVGDKHLTYQRDGKQYGDSIGLFQIRTFPDRPHRDLLKDPYINVRYAYVIYTKHGFAAWSVFKSGKYEKFLSNPIPVLNSQHKHSI